MGKSNWHDRAGTPFTCEKQPAHGKSGMVVTNHPLASAAGMEMLAAGGNAIDAAVASQFALTVVEPMMVGLIGGTTMHVRLADGHLHTVIDGMSANPRAGHPTMYRPIPGAPPEAYDVEGRANRVGPNRWPPPARCAPGASRSNAMNDVAGRRDRARDPPRQPRLRRHALPLRLHRRPRPTCEGPSRRRPPATRGRP